MGIGEVCVTFDVNVVLLNKVWLRDNACSCSTTDGKQREYTKLTFIRLSAMSATLYYYCDILFYIKHVIGVSLLSQSAPEKHSQETYPQTTS